jgi:hypothetical protein
MIPKIFGHAQNHEVLKCDPIQPEWIALWRWTGIENASGRDTALPHHIDPT